MWQFLLAAFLAGLATLLTPCVFPMIPVTLAFFTKQSTTEKGEVDRAAVVKLAVTYCLGIILSFIAIGIGFAVLVGKTGAYRFATNPWVNLTFGVLFVVFGLAMLEIFELRLPASLQGVAGGRRSGTIGVLLMGLTFVISAFTCTAPFLGTIIAQAAGANGDVEALLRPILGMAVFASALALPFFVLALFPPLLSKLPRSGAWMATVKGAFGFIEIAAALKFLSLADVTWGWKILSREIYLGLTALVLTAGGLWLLGRLKLGHATPSVEAPPLRKFWAGLFIAVAVYCLYGMRATMYGVEGYLPPYRIGAKADTIEQGELKWVRDLEEAKALAQKENRRVLIDFTGHTCVNCRDVETRVFPVVSVKDQLRKFSLVRLYVDPGTIDDIVTTEAQAEKNFDYEDKSFGKLTQPLYGVIEPDGTIIAQTDYTVAKSADTMAAWLEKHAK